MTNKEAVERIIKIKNFGGMTIPVSMADIEALDLAIKALEEVEEWQKLKLICANEGIVVYKGGL